ncbi:LysR substrate-binding domain-containing protein [uncultured Roseibium sp.]|uniref:LysR substrate-binding domain-containing protein n=1 Tax=uncultured Roseibium sp. TaxID=1936171 RepID=UPI00321709D5
MKQLPSTAGLLAFEAVARHLSFRRAATELNITQGAVSQRIKTLETVLCQPLFHRNGNVVALTSEGLEFLPNARAILRDIFNATDRLVHKDSTSVLTIGCISTFAIKCLIPAIGDFTDENPEIEVRIRTPVPFEKSNFFDYDLTIQYGFADRWPSMIVTGLGEEELFPVCSPDYLRRTDLGSDVKALAQTTIIRTSSPLLYQDEWPLWLDSAGQPRLTFQRELNCDFLYPTYEAAIRGLGVAMGRTAVVENDIAAGLLVEPFSIRIESALGYHLVVSPERAQTEKVRRFCDWARVHLHTGQPR